jgi:hypothetical protein
MALAKRLTLGGLTLIAAWAIIAPTATATTIPTWSFSQCTTATTWSGLFGINNDEPLAATVTAYSVTGGVTLPNITIGTTQIAGFDANGISSNLERTATNLPTSLASFSVTMTLSWTNLPSHPGVTSATRTQVVSRPSTCAPVDPTSSTTAPTTATTTATTSTVATSSSTAAGTTTTTVKGSGTTVSVSSTTVAGSSTTQAVPVVVLGAPVPKGLPATGSHLAKRLGPLAALVLAAGMALVAISRVGRPADRRA